MSKCGANCFPPLSTWNDFVKNGDLAAGSARQPEFDGITGRVFENLIRQERIEFRVLISHDDKIQPGIICKYRGRTVAE